MIIENQTPLITTGVTILAEKGYGLEKIQLPDGEYTRQQLLQSLIKEWIPYFECHKCGRYSYCKFVQPHSTNPHKAKDIQCGVVVTTLDNFLLMSWGKILSYTSDQLEDFFAGLYHFSQFILDTELTIGSYLNRDYLEAIGEEQARGAFGFISHLRVHLDKFATEFKNLGDFDTMGRWVVVEGEAEEAFLKRLGDLRFYYYDLSGVDNYGGKGNAKTSKFKLYIKDLHRRGYSVSLQGDKDGSKKNQLEQLANAGLVDKTLIFPFSKDFEGSFPVSILHLALQHSGYEVDINWLTTVMAHSTSPAIIRIVEEKLGTEINKVDLARILANIVYDKWSDIYNEHKDSEIVKWLLFLRTGIRF